MVDFEPSTFRATLRGLNDWQKGPQAKEAFPRFTGPALNDRFPGNWERPLQGEDLGPVPCRNYGYPWDSRERQG